MNFNWKIYKELNSDLEIAGVRTRDELIRHYRNHGIKEGRLWNVYQKYPDFNPEIYKKMYVDLLGSSKDQLEEHWLLNGRKEGRKYKEDREIDSSIYDFIDGILYINLENRKDRKEKLLEEFKRVKIPMEKVVRIEAIYNKLGALGCIRSHIKCLEYAKERGWKNVLIFEDDFNFIENNEEIERGMRIVRDLIKSRGEKLVMLSGNIISLGEEGEGYVRCRRVLTGSGYIIKEEMYKGLMEVWKEGEKLLEQTKNVERYSSDVYWEKIETRYILKTRIGYQRSSYSDIIHCETNYCC